MKKLLIDFLLLTLAVSASFAQNPTAKASFTIRIEDAGTHGDISNVDVYVNEVRGADKLSGDDGKVSYELPTDRQCTVNIRKEGYKDTSFRVMASATSSDPNFLLILLRKNNPNKLIIYGRVHCIEGNGIPVTAVVLDYQGLSISTNTDEYGNYRFELPSGSFDGVKSYSIEVQRPHCENCSSGREDYNGNTLINKDFEIRCASNVRPDDRVVVNENNLAGNWVGKVKLDNPSVDFNAILQINVRGGVITGTMRLEVETNARIYNVFNLKGSYTEDSITINEVSVADAQNTSVFCFQQFLGGLSQIGGALTFAGRWNNDDHRWYISGSTVIKADNCPGGPFTLTRVGH